MRLAFLLGQPPSVVMGWPASDLRLLGEYMDVQPAPLERLEILLAHLGACHFSTEKRPVATEKFLLFRNSWRSASSRYSENDLEILDSIDRIG